MAGSSNFIVFNPTLANADSDTTYQSKAAVTSGLVNGLSDTTMHNKLFHQVSVMAAALAQYMANQGQTVSDSDVNALAMAIANTIMPRGATFLDTGADANTYVWQNGVYSCTENVANMPVPGHTWIVNAEVIDSNDVCLNAYDLTTPGSLYIRQKSAGAWSAWFTPAPANATSTTPGLVEIAASPLAGQTPSAIISNPLNAGLQTVGGDLSFVKQYTQLNAEWDAPDLTLGALISGGTGPVLITDTLCWKGQAVSATQPSSNPTASVITSVTYAKLRYGKFSAGFRIKSNNNTATGNIVTLEVVGTNNPTTIVSSYPVVGTSFPDTTGYHMFYVIFDNTGQFSGNNIVLQLNIEAVASLQVSLDSIIVMPAHTAVYA